MTASPDLSADLEWRPYYLQGAVSRMRQFIVRGAVEYELCAEGGQWVIKRTERKGNKTVITETARGRQRDAEAVWARIVYG